MAFLSGSAANTNALPEAVRHALKGNDPADAGGLIAHHRNEILSAEQWHRLNQWLRWLPPGTDEDNPELQGRLAKAVKWVAQFDPEPFAPIYRFYTPQMTFAKALIAQRSAENHARADGFLARLGAYLSITMLTLTTTSITARASIIVLALTPEATEQRFEILLREEEGDV